MLFFALIVASFVVSCMGGSTTVTAPLCDQERTSRVTQGGLYKVDGAGGMTVESYVKFANLRGNRVHVCEIGVRFPAPSRVTHCLPDAPNVCPPGATIAVDLNLPSESRDQFIFRSVGFGVNKDGHPNGNYEEYREAQIAQGNPPSTWSWNVPHVDAHFYHVPASEIQALSWNFPVDPTPSLIARRCECEPAEKFIPSGFYSERDCIPGMGRHWAQDKLETKETFLSSPALIYGTYNCKPFFWEPMVTDQTLQWVKDNGIGQQATISFPQPHDYFWSAEYPTHYSITGVTDEARKIGGGDTYAISFKNFVFRPGSGPRSAGIDDEDAKKKKKSEANATF